MVFNCLMGSQKPCVVRSGAPHPRSPGMPGQLRLRPFRGTLVQALMDAPGAPQDVPVLVVLVVVGEVRNKRKACRWGAICRGRMSGRRRNSVLATHKIRGSIEQIVSIGPQWSSFV